MMLLGIAGGIAVGTQAAVNGALGRTIGVVETSFVSFLVGAACLGIGTLAFGGGNLAAVTTVPWGANGEEFRHLVDAGLSPLAAIEAGTANGPLTLGPQAPRSARRATGQSFRRSRSTSAASAPVSSSGAGRF